MMCKHCGKRLVQVTMYMEADSFSVAANGPAGAMAYIPPVHGIQSTPPAAAAPQMPWSVVYPCSHEPADEPINAAGGNYQ